MKVISQQFAVHSTILAVVFAGAARANDVSTGSKQDFQAKFAYCEQCHGPSGRGFQGFYPIPRLAGQQTEYMQNQLQVFAERRRENNIMFNVARSLSPEMIAGLATKFHDLNPKPLGGAPKGLIAAGKTIFEEGIPDGKVPPCSSCHGQDAKGKGPSPRLAGQLFDYTSSKLIDWGKDRQDPLKLDKSDLDKSAGMRAIARSLTLSQIKAISAYLSDLE